MVAISQISSYPDPVLTFTCYLITLTECCIWLIYAILMNEAEEGSFDKAGPKSLFAVVSFAIAYFLIGVVVPDGLYLSEAAWQQMIPSIFACCVLAAALTWAVYGLSNSDNRYLHLLAILVLAHAGYFLMSAFGHVSDSPFAFYVFAIFIGSNTAYVFMKLGR